MKLFKWYLISDLDLYMEEQAIFKAYKNEIKILQEELKRVIEEKDKLKKENESLKATQKIEIINIKEGWLEDVKD